MKLRFAEWVAKGIQASRFGWKSERRKGIGCWSARDLLVLTDFSIRGVGPAGRQIWSLTWGLGDVSMFGSVSWRWL
jgi:hypothetical protein